MQCNKPYMITSSISRSLSIQIFIGVTVEVCIVSSVASYVECACFSPAVATHQALWIHGTCRLASLFVYVPPNKRFTRTWISSINLWKWPPGLIQNCRYFCVTDEHILTASLIFTPLKRRKTKQNIYIMRAYILNCKWWGGCVKLLRIKVYIGGTHTHRLMSHRNGALKVMAVFLAVKFSVLISKWRPSSLVLIHFVRYSWSSWSRKLVTYVMTTGFDSCFLWSSQ
jgi:hypothetical protein